MEPSPQGMRTRNDSWPFANPYPIKESHSEPRHLNKAGHWRRPAVSHVRTLAITAVVSGLSDAHRWGEAIGAEVTDPCLVSVHGLGRPIGVARRCYLVADPSWRTP